MTVHNVVVTQGTSLDSGSDMTFVDALDSAGMTCKIKVNDQTATVMPTPKPDSGTRY